MLIHWYPGHMATGLKKMARKTRDLDVVLELRDARIPRTSALPQLTDLFRHVPRVIVYNKADLSEEAANGQLASTGAILCSNESKLKTDTLPIIRQLASTFKNDKKPHYKLMVVGVPNVGKSTIINRLRAFACKEGGGAAVKVGNLPGVTRSISGLVRICDRPLLYMYDSPGILVPKFTSQSAAYKLALTGAIPGSQVDDFELLGFFLGMVQRSPEMVRRLCDFYQCTAVPDLAQFAEQAANRLGLLQRGGTPNLLEAARDVIRRYRAGKFGRLTLDD